MFSKSFPRKKRRTRSLLKRLAGYYKLPPANIKVLEIKSLVLPVHIGRTREERLNTQDVSFNIFLVLPARLKGEKTDEFKDSVCYFKICERIRQLSSQNKFFLIEKLAFEVFTDLKTELPFFTKIQVSVHKLNPPVPNLKGGVSYTYGDNMTGIK